MLKRLLNKSEEATNEVLKPLSDKWGAHAFVKVKAASILPIEKSRIDDSEFRFALQSEFDFVVTDDDLQPLFAVEFDGETIKQSSSSTGTGKRINYASDFVFRSFESTSGTLSVSTVRWTCSVGSSITGLRIG